MTLEQLHILQCAVEGVPMDMLKRKCRKRPNVRLRTAFAVVAYSNGYTIEKIGQYIGRDHSTVINMLKVYREEPLGNELDLMMAMVNRLLGNVVARSVVSSYLYPGLSIKIIDVRVKKKPALSLKMKRLLDAILEHPKAGDHRLRSLTGLTLGRVKAYRNQLKKDGFFN